MHLEITPAELKRRLDSGEPLHLIDCREPHEHSLCRIAGAELIPMNSTPQHLEHMKTLAGEAPVIVYCHHGVRSLMVVNWLREQDLDNCASLSGGIDLWSATIDPSVPRY